MSQDEGQLVALLPDGVQANINPERKQDKQKNLIVVDDIEELGNIISRYDELKDKMANGMEMHNAEFCRNFGQIVDELVKGG